MRSSYSQDLPDNKSRGKANSGRSKMSKKTTKRPYYVRYKLLPINSRALVAFAAPDKACAEFNRPDLVMWWLVHLTADTIRNT